MMTDDLPVVARPAEDLAIVPGFESLQGFEALQRIAKVFSTSRVVPRAYQGNVADCIIVTEFALRNHLSPWAVMQGADIINGNFYWKPVYLIGQFNACGRYTSIQYHWNEAHDSVYCSAVELATGEVLTGSVLSYAIAKRAGWWDRKGSQWAVIPEQMLKYRAASFFIRTTAPELAMGILTSDEARDMGSVDSPARAVPPLQTVRTILEAEPMVRQGYEASQATASRMADDSDDSAPPPPDEASPVNEVSISGRASSTPLQAQKTTPRTAGDARPVFDFDAYARKIARCADMAVLQLLGEEIDAMPETAERDALAQLVLDRHEQLAGE